MSDESLPSAEPLELEPPQPIEQPQPDVEPIKPSIDELWDREMQRQQGEESRFSLRELLIALSVACVTLALARQIQLKQAAAILGFLTIGFLLVVFRLSHPHRILRLISWLLIALYAIVSFAVLVGLDE